MSRNSGSPARRSSGRSASTRMTSLPNAAAISSANESRKVMPSRSHVGRGMSYSARSCAISGSGTGSDPTTRRESVVRIARIQRRSSWRLTSFSFGSVATGTFREATSSKSWSSVASQKNAVTGRPCFSMSRLNRTSEASLARVYSGPPAKPTCWPAMMVSVPPEDHFSSCSPAKMPHCLLDSFNAAARPARRGAGAPPAVPPAPRRLGAPRRRNRSSPFIQSRTKRFIPGYCARGTLIPCSRRGSGGGSRDRTSSRRSPRMPSGSTDCMTRTSPRFRRDRIPARAPGNVFHRSLSVC